MEETTGESGHEPLIGRLRAIRMAGRVPPGVAGLVRRVDLVATFVFAFGGAGAAVDAGLDIFGVLVIGFTASLVGGLVRDVLIGDIPPAALRYMRYPVAAFAAGTVAIAVGAGVHDLPIWLVITFNAAGLGLFSVTGALKSHEYGLNALTAVMLGTVSSAGGGVVRDVRWARFRSCCVSRSTRSPRRWVPPSPSSWPGSGRPAASPWPSGSSVASRCACSPPGNTGTCPRHFHTGDPRVMSIRCYEGSRIHGPVKRRPQGCAPWLLSGCSTKTTRSSCSLT